jgi:ATP-dependent Lhr-like helicase
MSVAAGTLPTMATSLDLFGPATRQWFAASFAGPTPAQDHGWPKIAEGHHTLIHAPTGSGKTLAAFLWGIDRLMAEPVPAERRRCRLLYVSPLKALAYDIDRNLRAPLAGITNAARSAGLEAADITTAMRTGDTPSEDRRRMLRHPPDILITTPESLYLMLTSSVREILAPVRWVIVDEIHSIAASKRGSHLALSLERLEQITEAPPQRIGLSATQRPLEAIGEFLGGGTPTDAGWEPRPVAIVDAPRDRRLEIEVVVPVDDMTRPDLDGDPEEPPRRSIWPAVYPRLLDLIRSHRSTIVFANSRSLVERMAAELNTLAGEEIAKAHHGSVAREQRVAIEDALKRGDLPCVVATSSLELGVDMDAVDLVLLVESPTSVARGLQRVGRAGHQVGVPSRAKVFPKHRGDLLEATVVVDRMRTGLIEETRIPSNPLDVLAQQVVAAVAVEDWKVDDLYDMFRRAAPFADLGREPFEATLDMLSGRYPSDDFAELRPRIVWDRVAGMLRARDNARMLAVTNPGTIPDRGLYRVVLPEGGRVGELDEEMVYESRVGDTFVLGSTTWRITEITADRVAVIPAPGEPVARLPFWHGDRPGRPLETGRAVGQFVRTFGALDPQTARAKLIEDYRLDARAAANLIQFLTEEREATGVLPSDRTIVVQQFRDEIGDWRVVVLSPFGARIHAPWAMAAARRLRERHGGETDAVWSDDGIILRFPDAEEIPDSSELILDPEEVERLVIAEAGESALFAARFREAAARALLLPRRRPGRRTPLWLQRRKATGLLDVAGRYPSFPIVLETYREILQDHFDVPALREVLAEIRSRKIRVAQVETAGPSPFASSLMFDFIASFLYEYDAPPAERRALALTLDHGLLRDLLGEPELRDLLSPVEAETLELELQRLAEDRRVSGSDGIGDLLRHLGPLTAPEIEARAREPERVAEALADLEREHRVIAVRVGGARHWAAAEDAGRLRDALGIQPPPGVPAAYLEPVDDPLGDVVSRYARTHAPFTPAEAAESLGLPPAVITDTLERLERRGRVTRGAFRPVGADREWVDVDVLRRLRRRSLAAARSEVEAADPAAFSLFLTRWHGLASPGRGATRLVEVIRRLQGVALPASILEADVLPARLDYSADMLDALTASGEVVWIGRGPLGARDGRVGLYLRDQVPLLAWPLDLEIPAGELHEVIRNHLAERGASFFRDLYDAAGGGDPDTVLDAIWDLVWAGLVTNDTLAPLRARLWGRARRVGRRGPRLPSASAPPSGSGRWYLVADLSARSSLDTEKAMARADQLLERHGIITGGAVRAEAVPGGFAGLSPILAAMEEAGRVRRGYFVDGLGGSQFALPGALDRLRAESETGGTLVVAAADPANPYGAAIPWPETDAGRPSRSAGAHAILIDGHMAAFLERGGRTILTFTEDDGTLDRIAAALADHAARRRPRLTIATVDGRDAASTALGTRLTAAGFTPSYKGLVRR